MARPSDYDKKINNQMLNVIKYWVTEGKTEEQIAKRLDIAYSTLRLWKKKHEEFSAALKENRAIADDLVEGSLFNMAMAENVTACIFWLKNRKPEKWRDKPKDFEGDKEIKIFLNGEEVGKKNGSS